MNIVIHSPTKPGFSETFIKNHINLLPFNCFNIYSLPNRGYFPLFDGNGNKLFSTNIIFNYLEAGLDKLTNESTFGYYFRKPKLKSFLKENNIKFILAEYGPTGTYLIDISKELGIPIIPYFWGRDAFHHQTLKRFSKKYLRLFDQAPLIFAVSGDMKKQLIKLGANPDKILVHRGSPNTSIFFDHGNERKKKQLLFVGRFVPKKSPLSTIKAFEMALKYENDLNLVMIGDGILKGICESYVQSRSLSSKIEFPGKKNSTEIATYMNESFGYIQHSVIAPDGDSEGMPVAILEAMATGLPIISTIHAGIPEIVTSEDFGYLTPENDIEAMSISIKRLFSRNDIHIMRSACKNVINQNFTIKKDINTMAKAIKTLV